MTHTRETNEEFILDLINFGPYGGLQQVFLIEAIRSYSERISKLDPASFEGGLIAPEAWVGTAKYIFQKVEARYGDSKDSTT